ncbi:MAG: extracellular catalytic domain type 1 short-chain-length polyhydroxyalkanoate depolymerase [Beijerinckiaceae bacterium]
MRPLGETLARLRQWQALPFDINVASGRLRRLWNFGSNPGALRAWQYRPVSLTPHAPLVVVLHGCKQTASGYDTGAGWSALADEAGFAVLFPEQSPLNNLFRCFNWFQPGDVAAIGGELESIRQMIEAMVRAHRLDPKRVYVTGLSAGGAMTAALLARFPGLFAGGGIVAGVPFGVAMTPQEAFERMAGNGLPDVRALAQIVAGAAALPAAAAGAPPLKLSVWHGDADETVAIINSIALIAQFRPLLDVPTDPYLSETVGPAQRRAWRDGMGRERLEFYRVPGMGHGTPIFPGEQCGAPAPYMIDAGICSTRKIAHYWGIAAALPQAPERKARPQESWWRRGWNRLRPWAGLQR